MSDVKTMKSREPELTFRKPTAKDGAAVWELVRECSPLDENSMYCNLLQCDHFRDTCIVVERAGDIVGWISGYIVPDQPDTFFVWQVAVSPKARGLGLAGRMLKSLLSREECAEIEKMQTTITRDNEASWALFKSFARKAGGELSHEPHFKRDAHFDGHHDTEHMVTIRFAEPLAAAA